MMRPNIQKIFTFVVGASAAVVLSISIGLLLADHLEARRRTPIDKQRFEALRQLAREDDSYTQELVDQVDRQAAATLDRQVRSKIQTFVCVVAATLFVICAKWLVSLTAGSRPAPSGVYAGSTRRLYAGGIEHKREQVVGDTPIDLSFVDSIVADQGRPKGSIIPILQAIQSHYRYLPEEALLRVCELTDISPARITSVSTFYKQFRHYPVGRHIVKICHGTACHVAGARQVTNEIRRYLSIPDGADTDPRRDFTLEEVACLGCCTLAPVIQIDGVTYGHMTPDRVPEVLNNCLSLPIGSMTEIRKSPAIAGGNNLGQIRIGLGSCCVAGGSRLVHDALARTVVETRVPATVKRVGCVGMCHRTPLVEVIDHGRDSSLYAGVLPRDAKSIVRRHFKPPDLSGRIGNAICNLWDNLLSDQGRDQESPKALEVSDPQVAAFLNRQKRIATEHCGRIDPTDLDDYLEHAGFEGLSRCVRDFTPDEMIEHIRRSGLRGRGGAGYPTFEKWMRVRRAAGDVKYIICNGDEGDPGVFMDRMLMESYPYRIIEGMAIAAYAVGARQGYVYIRAEYPLAVQRVREAIHHCEQRDYLGSNILGTGLSLRLEVFEGAGAFVCGEETALLASIEGRRGTPRLRPPYPAERGLWGAPTLMSNVETYALVPWIIRNGPEAFAALGTKTSTGTKVFALTGKVKRGGLIEVPMGITIREIVEEIGGGIKNGRGFKAIQIGGPSGGCVPAELAGIPVDYEALAEVGATMGSGGLVVLDESDCMVDMARYFLAFTQDQSCGQCTYCRIGTRRMLDILDRLCTGGGRADDLDRLEQLALMIKRSSLCGLGKTAPNPVLTTLRYFRSEYEAHLAKRCPAGKCPVLITYCVTDACIGCTLCAQHCPAEAIAFRPYQKHEIDADKCTRCGICLSKCPEQAIEVE